MTRSVPSVGKMVRVLLEQAVDDGLVEVALPQWDDPDLHARTAEELACVAGFVARHLRDGTGAVRKAALPIILDRPAGAGGL